MPGRNVFCRHTAWSLLLNGNADLRHTLEHKFPDLKFHSLSETSGICIIPNGCRLSDIHAELSVYVPDCVQLGVYIHLVGCVIAGFYVENYYVVVFQCRYGGIAFCSVSRVAVSCGSFRSDPFRLNTVCHPLQKWHRSYYDRARKRVSFGGFCTFPTLLSWNRKR